MWEYEKNRVRVMATVWHSNGWNSRYFSLFFSECESSDVTNTLAVIAEGVALSSGISASNLRFHEAERVNPVIKRPPRKSTCISCVPKLVEEPSNAHKVIRIQVFPIEQNDVPYAMK